ncbi:condensation domain-containing protein, partial [Chryseobacterium sp. NRRL B-14859]|uniref:condensation domain-containing protein n=1 Tax=Chryseobacterium sp. NRRL B-14859 TaxID=1562763 RepID=UPI0033920ECC
ISSTGYHYSQLADIQNESGLGKDLFDHILIYENYPVQDMMGQEMNDASELRILGYEEKDYNNYNLTVSIAPGAEFSFRFSYNPRVYSKEIMSQLKGHLLHLISVLVSNPEQPLSSLD